MKIVQTLNDNKYRSTWLSIFLCLIVLVISLLLHPIYETNDDPAMEILLYGKQGVGGTSFLVFFNRVLGVVLFSLVSAFPVINWYFLMHYSVCLISMYIIAKTIIDKFKKHGILLCIVVLAASMESLYLVQFTKTAAIAAIAGTIGLLYSLQEKDNKIDTGICIALVLMAGMIRLSALESVCPFLIIVIIFELLDLFKHRKCLVKKYIIYFSVILFLLVLCYLSGAIINKNTPGSDEYYQYNTYRSNVVDYELDQDKLADADSEILMAANWMHNDPEVFTSEKLEALSKTYCATVKFTDISKIEVYFSWLLTMMVKEPILAIAVVVAIFVLLFSKRKTYVIPLVLSFFAVEWYLVITGRYSYHRVSYGILLALFLSLVYLSELSLPDSFSKSNIFKSKVLICSIVAVCVSIICLSSIKNYMTFKEQCRSLRDSLNIATNESNCKYMIHPLVYDVDVERNIYDVPDHTYGNNFFFMGGWRTGVNIPGVEESSCISGNAWQQCVDSQTIRLVVPSYYGEDYMDIIEWYIEEHYNVDVESISIYKDDYTEVFKVVSSAK